jgi:hypothetical protein
MHTRSAQQQQQQQLWCYTPSISDPGGVAATQHKVQHDRPPLPGSYRDTYSFHLTYMATVSRWIPRETAFLG